MNQTCTKKAISDYTFFLKNKIGDGAYSQVFKGKHQKTEQSVAIKVVSLSKAIKGNTFKNVELQINALYKFKDMPNIVEVKSVVQTKNSIYIMTEFCEQGNLRQWIKQEKCFSQKTSIDVIKQIINGYRSIAKAGIIHRDLKPDNILVKKSEIKIGDFGFAINVDECYEPLNQNIGSPLYMAPQALISNKYSFQSDIWAIGLIFFEMLKGSSPWKSHTQVQLKSELLKYKIEEFMPKKISQKSKEFLTKTLQIHLSKRMSLQQLLQFQFVDNYIEEQKTVSVNTIQKNNNDDKSTIEQCSNQISQQQLSTQRLHLMIPKKQINKSTPDLNSPKCKRLSNKKTISYNNQYQKQIAVDNDKKWFNEIQIQKNISNIDSRDSKLLNIASQSILSKNTKSFTLSNESQQLFNKSTIEKFLQRSTSIILECKSDKSNACTPVPFVSSINLQELPQLYENEEQQDEESLKIMKQNKLKYINQKQVKMPQLQTYFSNSGVLQSIFIDKTAEIHAQNEKNLQNNHPFYNQLKQLTAQIYYFKFLNQIIKNISKYLKTSNQKIQIFKSNLIFLALQKLEQLKNLKLLKIAAKQEQFLKTKQYLYCENLINGFKQKYKQRYSESKPQMKSNKQFLSNLSIALSLIYKNVLRYQYNQEQMKRKKMIIIILDSLISFSSLYFLDKQQNWSKFQLKSNIYELSSRSKQINIDKQYFQSVCKRYNQLIKN